MEPTLFSLEITKNAYLLGDFRGALAYSTGKNIPGRLTG